MQPTHLSLFTGIAGIDLAAEWAGFKTVGQCEYADYPKKVLEKHWPDLPRWRDVRDVTRDELAKKSINEITLLSGGFPCQPHSLAGKRMASGDERDLWGEFRRVICEVRPKWVLGENVAGLLSSENGRFFGRVLGDLAGMGYRVGWGSYGAFNAGAAHGRKRVFIIAYCGSIGLDRLESYKQKRCGNEYPESYEEIKPLEVYQLYANTQRVLTNASSGVSRNDDGVSEAMDRFKCIGNSVMPQQIYPIIKTIYDIETAA